jgi:citrate lyase subunit beta/citryl-CoA lyase
MIVAARSAGVDAVDGPYANFGNPQGYERQAVTFSMLGGVGKWCIHPSQVPIANRVFAPTMKEIDDARAAVAAVAAAEANGLGAASVNGVMIDAATARMFQGVLDRAARCGLLMP